MRGFQGADWPRAVHLPVRFSLGLGRCGSAFGIGRRAFGIGRRAFGIMTPATATGDPHFGENFRRLVLGCMGTYDSESRRIFSHFSRSTRFAFLCTAPHSNICQFFRLYFCNFFHRISSFFANFESISRVFEQILMKIWRNFTGLKNASQNFGEISNFDGSGVLGFPKKAKTFRRNP